MKSIVLLKLGMVILLAMVLVGWYTARGVSAQDDTAHEAIAKSPLTALQSLPVVQITTHPEDDAAPTLVQMTDGKLLAVFMRNGSLWSSTSTDGGAVWGSERQIDGCCRYSPRLARTVDGTDEILWLLYDKRTIEEIPPYVIEKREIWYRTSVNGGSTWSTESRLPTDSNRDYSPVMSQSPDHRLWLVWESGRFGNASIWYKTSADGGTNWSADTRLATDGRAPTATVTPEGRVVVVYNRGDRELWQRTSSDGGVTWSTETRIAGCCRTNSSLAAVGGVLWLAYENDGDILYRTSTNQGANWSVEALFTRFVGSDSNVALGALAPETIGFVWNSGRSGNSDLWFGNPPDSNPPPYVEWIEQRPGCNPDSDDVITFRARVLDETEVASVQLMWTLNGEGKNPIDMMDDGEHEDDAGDGVWGVQHAALPTDSTVTYSVRATDRDGNAYVYPSWSSFRVQPVFAKTTDLLFVPDDDGYDTSRFRLYYADALDALGITYDTWDTSLRCAPSGAILDQYTRGIVIWVMPFGGYLIGDSSSSAALQRYLDGGGKLFVTGQEVGYGTAGTQLLSDYLHASYVQDDSGSRTVTGQGLAFDITGGDGADNQYYPDEVDPIVPAEVLFTYQAGAAAMAVQPTPSKETLTAPPEMHRAPDLDGSDALHQMNAAAKPAADVPAAPAGCNSSCTAGLFVDTGTYRVVYFAFGFEAIDSAAHRKEVMALTLTRLTDKAMLLSPHDAEAFPTGNVTFNWSSVPDVTAYNIQIDTVPTFDSPDRIGESVNRTSYDRSFADQDTYYWRVQASGGEWSVVRSFTISRPVNQVTTDLSDDTAPSLVQTADNKLLSVFVRNGELWSRTSADDGVTWGAETRIAGCCHYHPSLVRAYGKVWLAYERDGDIWYRSIVDDGVTWTAEPERQLTTQDSDDYDPVLLQAAHDRLVIAWVAVEYGYYRHIWFRTSVDGIAWSAVRKISLESWQNDAPAMAATSDGRLVAVWRRYDELLQRSSSDGGATWSDETRVSDGNLPSLTAVGDGLWLVYTRDGDIRYRTSVDQGATWSDEMQFTFFVGSDTSPAAAVLTSGKVGIVWQSDRSGNPDIWFGNHGEQNDINPPPYISHIEHQPTPNPDDDDMITFRARILNEKALATVQLVWMLDGDEQDPLAMYDDGAHDDDNADDGVWGSRHEPLPADSYVSYRVRAADVQGNTYLYPGQNFFTVLPAFVKTAAILLVLDAGGDNTPSDTAWFQPYYTDALESLGKRYNTWDTALRGGPNRSILEQYIHGVVVWAVPYWGSVTNPYSTSIGELQAFLDAGGRLFIAGQNIAERVGSSFCHDYLHATLRQEDTGLYALSGIAGDAIGDGLGLNISGGDGANNQYSKDEVDPVTPAEVIFTYRAGVSAMLAEPVRPAEAEPAVSSGADVRPDAVAASVAATPEGNIGSGTAGLRVNTGNYKVVYLAFGFEAINNAADRRVVMERVLHWLEIVPTYLPFISHTGD